jgi:hypothetical protein
MPGPTLNLPPLFDISGNINIHGRSGLVIPFKMFTAAPPPQGAGTQIDISGSTMFFEVAGVLRQQLTTDPGDALGLLLTIASLSASGIGIGPPAPDYCIRDETGAVPIVRAQGQIVAYAYETAPP